ncbi:MAG: GGDEF domain-containing protein [Verrucomicrobia bacterium]|nr:GGDEF domain-containing protein [Verrucomicrobiota bacterium]MCH8513195.1 GGDEF domain-containing protein [Kiritimatiellia bacterium]
MYPTVFLAVIPDAPPPISPVQMVLQILAVAVSAFVILALVLSYLRYQHMVVEATERVKHRADRESLLLFLAEQTDLKPYGLIRLLPEDPLHLEALQKKIKPLIRESDQLILTDLDELMLFFPGTPGIHMPRILHRIAPAISEICENGRISCEGSDFCEGTQLQVAVELLEFLREDPTSDGARWNFPDAPLPFEPEVIPGQEHLLDEVTGVLKPELTGTAIQKVLATHRRRVVPAGILMFAVDDLETYAQSHGRDVAHAVLGEAGAVLMRSCRESDFIAGLEEEKLVICMTGSPETLVQAAQRICAEARASSVERDGETLRFTLSAGVSAYPSQGSGPQRLLSQAETALEAARKRGRGSCLLFEESMIAHQSSAGAMDDAPDSF